MRILITGATGFIGTHLCQKLLADNHEIMAISRSCRVYENGKTNDELTSRIHWISSTLILSGENLKKIDNFGPEVLIHLAWEKIPDFSFDVSYENIQSQISFFRMMLEVSSIKKIIAAGSCWEYNKSFGQCSINDPCTSKDYFTWAKNSIHDFLRFECTARHISLCWARIFYVYGPNQRDGSLIPTLIRTIRSGLVPDLRSPANANDFIYVDDVVSAFEQMMRMPVDGVFNIGSGKAVSVLDICRLVEKRLNGKTELTMQLTNRSGNTPPSSDFWADIDSSQALLAWKPVVTITEGIDRMIQFI